MKSVLFQSLVGKLETRQLFCHATLRSFVSIPCR